MGTKVYYLLEDVSQTIKDNILVVPKEIEASRKKIQKKGEKEKIIEICAGIVNTEKFNQIM